MALSDTTTPKVAPLKAPFFSTALGHTIASLGATVVVYAISLVLNDQSLASALGISGIGYSILTAVRLVLDPTVLNLPK